MTRENKLQCLTFCNGDVSRAYKNDPRNRVRVVPMDTPIDIAEFLPPELVDDGEVRRALSQELTVHCRSIMTLVGDVVIWNPTSAHLFEVATVILHPTVVSITGRRALTTVWIRGKYMQSMRWSTGMVPIELYICDIQDAMAIPPWVSVVGIDRVRRESTHSCQKISALLAMGQFAAWQLQVAPVAMFSPA
jgi:hypothetical protein